MGMKTAPLLRSSALAAALAIGGGLARAEPVVLNNHGHSGLLDMPSARMMTDGEFAVSYAWSEHTQRVALSFQPLPWLEGTFRFSAARDFLPGGDSLNDRSFGLKLRLSRETEFLPAIAVGIQDVLGTGLYAGEYVVASKTVEAGAMGTFDVTLGLGWGRLGSTGMLRNPLSGLSSRFDERRAFAPGPGDGDLPLFKTYFRGRDTSLFGGIVWSTPVDGLKAIVEYSGDAYLEEEARGLTGVKSHWNFGLVYRPAKVVELAASYMNGDTLGLRLTLRYDPYFEVPKGLDPQPPPPYLRTEAQRQAAAEAAANGLAAPAPAATGSLEAQMEAGGWADLPAVHAQILDGFVKAARAQGLDVEAVELTARRAIVYYRNDTYLRETEALQRLMRAALTLPPSVENFYLVAMAKGAPATEAAVNRTAYERNAMSLGDGAELLPKVRIASAPQAMVPGAVATGEAWPRFSWSITPAFQTAVVDTETPFQAGAGLRFGAGLDFGHGFEIEGAFEVLLLENFEAPGANTSLLPRVRSDVARYAFEGGTGLASLTVSKTGKIGRETWYRLSAGLLEDQFAGAGGELLYRPDNSRWSFGANLYYVRQREFDRLFGLRDYDTVTGQISAYGDRVLFDTLDFNVHAGRYLAGDWGATFEVMRRFDSGIEIGVFATFTDVPFETFGEGSFDKGLILRIPLGWFAPFSTQTGFTSVLRTARRDGGARLFDINPLWDDLRRTSPERMRKTWPADIRPPM
jgi:hypothetical protein